MVMMMMATRRAMGVLQEANAAREDKSQCGKAADDFIETIVVRCYRQAQSERSIATRSIYIRIYTYAQTSLLTIIIICTRTYVDFMRCLQAVKFHELQ